MSPTNDMPKRTYEHLQKDQHAFRFVFVSAIVFTVIMAFLILHTFFQVDTNSAQLSRAEETQVQLVQFLRENCRKAANPLRAGLREDARLQKIEALHPDPRVLKALKLDLSHKQIRELTEKKVERLNYNIHVRYHKLDCDAVFSLENVDPTPSEDGGATVGGK